MAEVTYDNFSEIFIKGYMDNRNLKGISKDGHTILFQCLKSALRDYIVGVIDSKDYYYSEGFLEYWMTIIVIQCHKYIEPAEYSSSTRDILLELLSFMFGEIERSHKENPRRVNQLYDSIQGDKVIH
jgi:hypothetical protein